MCSLMSNKRFLDKPRYEDLERHIEEYKEEIKSLYFLSIQCIIHANTHIKFRSLRNMTKLYTTGVKKF